MYGDTVIDPSLLSPAGRKPAPSPAPPGDPSFCYIASAAIAGRLLDPRLREQIAKNLAAVERAAALLPVDAFAMIAGKAGVDAVLAFFNSINAQLAERAE